MYSCRSVTCRVFVTNKEKTVTIPAFKLSRQKSQVALRLRFRELSGSKMGRKPAILTEVSRIFPQSLHVNAETLSQIKVRPRLPHYFQLIIYKIIVSIHDTLI
jgi:hypothetical protein